MKIAVLGGSFNPLHIGHTMLADTVIKELGYDKVLFVPTYVPPHKKIAGGVSAEHRFNMVKAFCDSEGSGHFEAEPCELERGGVSYTYDTLLYLTKKYKKVLDGKIAFIMGEEVAAEFDKWSRAEKIPGVADFIIVNRYPDFYSLSGAAQKNVPTGDYKGDFAEKFDAVKFGYKFTHLENPMLPVSSTEIRYRIASNKSFRYLVPQAIFDYILKYELYR